jgi:hydroxymethylpyrimidine pyrophosphatase-like HAD family hydrolase
MPTDRPQPPGCRLLVTDLDGTLLDQCGTVRACDQEAIAALQRRGVVVSIVTGRMYFGSRVIAHSLRLSGPIGCIDGSHIVNLDDDRDLFCQPLRGQSAGLLRRVLAALCPVTFVLSCETILYDAAGYESLRYVTNWSDRVCQVKSVFDPQHWQGGLPPIAVVSLGTDTQVRGVRSQLAATTTGDLQTAAFALGRVGDDQLWALIVRAGRVSKGTAVAWIARHYGCSRAQIVAVGDWLNDIPMLRAAGRSFAMAHAPAEVQAAATGRLAADVFSGGAIREVAQRSGLL